MKIENARVMKFKKQKKRKGGEKKEEIQILKSVSLNILLHKQVSAYNDAMYLSTLACLPFIKIKLLCPHCTRIPIQ